MKFSGNQIILILSLGSFLVRLLTNQNYGFHRDEFLYLALGQHLDWGYWSNPPGPGFFSWITQNTLGDELWAIRFLPALLGGLTVLLTGLMAGEMKGGTYAKFLACLAIMISPAYSRVFLLYNPVPFDVFYWTLLAWLVLKFINTQQNHYLLWLGTAIGAGLLNKYTIFFFIFPLLVALLFSNQRRLFTNRYFYLSTAIACLLFFPNLLWQWQYNFPVVTHMQQLAQSQLANVSVSNFLLDQLVFNLSVIYIWIAGLIFLLYTKPGKPYRLIGWTFIGIIMLLILLKGKSYYTMGAYPMLIAAGACAIEAWVHRKNWWRIILPTLSIILFSITLPVSIPFLKLDQMVAYGKFLDQKLGLGTVLRWEDGETHALPQDYADMLGWKELVSLVNKAYQQVGDKNRVLLYCQNYGQAGAVDHLGRRYDLPPVVSFADSYLLWAPREIPTRINQLIYVNDTLGEDVQQQFDSIKLIGTVEHPYARERGTSVYLCQRPKNSLAEFWDTRIQQIRISLRLPTNR